MFEADEYRIRRRRVVNGVGYAVFEDDEPILKWTRRTADLTADFAITTPDGDPVLRITAENLVPDVAAAFTVVDAREGGILGLIRRNWRSVVKREFGLIDRYDLELASVHSRSRLLHVVRNQFIKLVPYWYVIENEDGRRVGSIRGRLRGGCTLRLDDTAALDPKLALATAIAVDAVEILV